MQRFTYDEHVTIEEGTRSTKVDQFSYNRNLLTVHLPESIREIAAKTFDDCVNLHQINFPNELQQIHPSAFQECKSLTSVDIPSSVIVIYGQAFRNCTTLSSVRFLTTPKRTMTLRICEWAFYACPIEELVVPENCQLEIGSFAKCPLKRIAFPLNYHYTPETRPKVLVGFQFYDARPFPIDQIFGERLAGERLDTLEKVKFYGPVADNREQTMKMLLQWHDFKNVTFIFDNFEIMDLLRNAIAARIDSGQAEGFFEGAVLRMNKYSSFDDLRQNAFSGGGDEEYINQVFEAMSLDSKDGDTIDTRTGKKTTSSKDIMLPSVKQMLLENITVPTMIVRAEAVEGTPKLSGSKVFPRPEPVDAPPTKRQAFGTK